MRKTIRAWTGPCAAKEAATALRFCELDVTEGTENVYVRLEAATDMDAIVEVRAAIEKWAPNFKWLEFRGA